MTNSSIRQNLHRCLVVLVVLLFCGCGPSLVVSKGRVTRGGSAFISKGEEQCRLLFISTVQKGDEPGYCIPIPLGPGGTFTTGGPFNKGIPRGDYRIAIILLGKDGVRDKLDDMFGPTTSRIIRKVDGKDIDIDIDRPEG